MSCAKHWRVCLCAIGLLAGPAVAGEPPWVFGEPLAVTAPPRDKVFHHMESAGRRGIAVSGNVVAIVWEDNRDGTPRAYAAFHVIGSKTFSSEHRLSNTGEAYEPVVAMLGDGRFLFGWEEGGQVWVRVGARERLGEPVRLSAVAAAQVTLATGGKPLAAVAAWSERNGARDSIRSVALRIDTAALTVVGDGTPHWVAPSPADQLYPALAVVSGRTMLAWEDRAEGHTVLKVSGRQTGKAWSMPQVLNAQLSRRSDTFGRGTGVARPVLTAVMNRTVAATWLDKRHFESGYDVYAAVTDPRVQQFQKNEKVQDEFGKDVGQWHAVIAATGDGRLVVAWDDDRDGSQDIWLAWRTRGAREWSGDVVLPASSAVDSESSPVLAVDEADGLHLAWLQQAAPGKPGRLYYQYAPVRK